MSADKFEEWLETHAPNMVKPDDYMTLRMRAAWLASRKAALDEAAKKVEDMGSDDGLSEFIDNYQARDAILALKEGK